MARIGLIGNYGATNIGDEAILEAILKNHSGHRFTVFSSNPEETQRRHGVESAPLFPAGVRSLLRIGFKKSLAALSGVDAVVLGGGGLFQDDRLHACLIWSWQVFWVKRMKKPLFIYATGVGPLRTWLGRKLTRYTYNYAQKITVRDQESYNLLVQIGVAPSKIFVTADPVFLLPPTSLNKNRTKNLFIISVRPWKNNEIMDTLDKFLKWLKENKKASFKIVSMQHIRESDDRLAIHLGQQLNEQIFYPKTFDELMKEMAQSEMAIGMRYHFAIAALLTKTPVLAMSYSPKVNALFREASNQCIDLEHLNFDRLKNGFEQIHARQEEIRAKERAMADHHAWLAAKNQELLEEFLKNI